jgi:hypothetical protein
MSNATEASRAEVVRRRRRQQAQSRVTRSSALATLATRPITPITERRSTTHAVAQRITPAKTKRRYQAAISMPGIELRMPVIHFTSRSLQWRLLSLAISLMLGTGLYFAWTSPAFYAAVPQVIGNTRLGVEQINSVLAVEGQPVFTLVPSELETRLRLNYPEVLSAQVILGLPNTVTVHVVERQPLISWQQTEGSTWIDEGGVAFRPRGTADRLISVTASAPPPPGLPSAKDPISPIPYISADLMGAIKTLAPSVPQGTTLVYDPQYGLGWSDGRGWQVYFGGDARDMPLKLQVYQALLKTLAGKGITPSFVSVQYANAPYYRTNQ